jgi:acetyl esterase/lipase
MNLLRFVVLFSILAARSTLAAETPTSIPLWDGPPPEALENASPEVVLAGPKFQNVSVPSISVYPATAASTGMALIICPGGGYGSLDWKTHVVYAAECMNPQGITIIGLKYRLRPPYEGPNERIQAVTLLDVKRAVRLVRSRAAEWKIDPQQIGVAGYSAGGNVAMNLAANFDDGDSQAADRIDRLSSRPDFVVGIATWHWRQKENPFTFRKHTPPVLLVHATNDGINGGAPIELPKAIAKQLEELGVPVKTAFFDQGAHGVGNLIPQRVQHKVPGAMWPDILTAWLAELRENVTK